MISETGFLLIQIELENNLVVTRNWNESRSPPSMLTDHQILEIVLTLLGIAALGLVVGLVVYFAYLKPNFFYGDHVVLSIVDVAGNTWWVKNIHKGVGFTSQQAEAAVLQFANGSSGQKGQLFEGKLTSFELRHPYYGAFLTATCQSITTDPIPGFGTTTGVQIGATSQGISLDGATKGAALRDGGQYHLAITGFDCEASGCAIESLSNFCDVSGCYFSTIPDADLETGFSTEINCGSPSAQQLWTFTKVNDLELYSEYKTETDFSFN